MKKYLSFIAFVMLTVFCFAFVSCGDDDDDEIENVLYSSGDFIELTVDGKSYHKKLIGIYSIMELGKKDMVFTGTTEDVFSDEGFEFYIGLTHSENKEKLLSSPLGTYSVGDSVVDCLLHDVEPANLCLDASYRKNRHEYELRSGSHQVTSIKQNKYGVQVCGTFKVTMDYNDESVLISGKYGLTVL